MKSFNYLRILFLAIISLSIISCTNDGGDDGLGSKSPMPDKGYKKLVQMNVIWEEHRYIREYIDYSVFYNYDKNGTITYIKCKEIDGDWIKTYNLDWGKDGFTIKREGDDFYEGFYKISNGKILEYRYEYPYSSKRIYNFEYGADGYLKKIHESYDRNTGFSSYTENYETEYNWFNCKINNVVYQETRSDTEEIIRSRTEQYTYDSQKCEGFFPYMLNHTCNDMLEAISYMFGLDQQYLPKSIKVDKKDVGYDGYSTSRSTSRYEFKYTFYDNGYLKSCTETCFKKNNTTDEYEKYSVCTYEYFWQ